MELKYYINDTQIDEPIGFDSFRETLRRTSQHGIVRVLSVSPLEFDGVAYDLISAAYNGDIDTELLLRAEIKCDGDLYFSEFFSGLIDLSTYEEKDCRCRCNIGESKTDETIFNNRSETVVDIERMTTLDGAGLYEYSNINRVVEIPAKEVQYESKIMTSEDDSFDVFGNIGDVISIQPKMDVLKLSEIPVIYANDTFSYFVGADLIQFQNAGLNPDITAYYSFDLSVRNNRIDATLNIQAARVYGSTVESLGSPVQILSSSISNFLISGSTGINYTDFKGVCLIAFQSGGLSLNNYDFEIITKKDSYISYRFLELLENTTSRLSFIHETLSRTAEIISGLTVKSDYYGRVDSQVNPTSGYGGGSMKAITTGLKMRNAVMPDSSLPRLQTSFRGLYESLTAIDNLGWAFEKSVDVKAIEPSYVIADNFTFELDETIDNVDVQIGDILYSIDDVDVTNYNARVISIPESGIAAITFDKDISIFFTPGIIVKIAREIKSVRVEPFQYFYLNSEVLQINNPAELKRSIDSSKIYSRLKIGYEKYMDSGEINSIDTFHTQRNYTTLLKAVDSELVRISKFIACPYAIEFTRRLTLDPTTENWKYDGDIFVIEIRRITDSVYTVKVGATNTGQTLISPLTFYNVALSPARNAIRHLPLLFAHNSTADKLEATAYTVNGTAIVQRVSDTGTLHDDSAAGGILTENETLDRIDPIFKAEAVEFEYPLSRSDWELLKQNKYKYITVDGVPCWINEVSHEFISGLTKFKLIPKNG